MSVAQRDPAKNGNGRNASHAQTQLNRLYDAEELSLALDISRRQLKALVRQNDELLGIRSSLTEKVSSLELALAKANQFAHYDELTGLPNRRLLLDRFIQAAALANRNRQVLALLFFDVNDFKLVNDKLGHKAGDELLQLVATRLSGSIRKCDTACRYGGDEFVILLTEINHREDGVKALQTIRAHLAPPYVVDRHSVGLTVSDGLAIFPRDAQCFTDLMQLADRSMFSNKSVNRCQSGGMPASNIWLHDAGKELCVSR
jgi:diguanylate cyclase (GGDEF)-like protein